MPRDAETPALQARRPSSLSACSDKSLLRKLRAGNERAAHEVHARYAHRLLALARVKCSALLARCVEPEDIVQSVFRTFFRQASRGEFDVPDGKELWGLLLVITLNRIRAMADFYQAAKRDVRTCSPLEGSELGRQKARDSAEDSALLQLVIDEELGRLPASRRAMIRLRMEGHEVAEIAELTQRSLRTVERVLHTFRENLRSLLHEDR